MAFFRDLYSKPGPGVHREAPRKTGAPRFFEILARDIADLVKLNFLFLACCAPSAALFVCFVLGVGGVFSIIFLLLSLVAAFPAGGAVSACYYCIAKMLRDDPGFVWFDFKRKFKENYLAAIPVGIFCVLVFYIQVYTLILLTGSGGAGVEPWMLVVNIVALLAIGMIMPYVFVQIPHFYLKGGALMKNSLILAFMYAPRSIMASVMGNAIWAVYAFFFPFSILFTPFIAIIVFSLNWLLTLMWIWKPVNEQFKIEETLAKRKEEAREGE